MKGTATTTHDLKIFSVQLELGVNEKKSEWSSFLFVQVKKNLFDMEICETA